MAEADMASRVERSSDMDIPVYLFTGFLDAGKTTFIQSILEAPGDGEARRTLLLLCEEGETEYNESSFAPHFVHIEVVDEETDLKEAYLASLAARYSIDEVFVEYNGMWMMGSLFAAMPPNWIIAQEICFMNAETFLIYNKNARQQTFDKMKTPDLLVFNRCVRGEFDKKEFHRQARIASRKVQIVYEYDKDDVEPDTIEDPLPFDKEASAIEIKPEFYAEWYRDINENPDDYEGKWIVVKGRVAMVNELPPGKFAFGRHVMTCCVQDIQFAALLAVYKEDSKYNVGDWIEIKAKVHIEYDDVYQEIGPVLYCRHVTRVNPVEPEVATF